MSRKSESVARRRKSVGDGVNIRRVDEKSGVACNFGHRGDVGGEHRNAARHGVQHRHSEALIQRGEREDGRALVEFFEFGTRDIAEHLDVLFARAAFDALERFFGIEAERSGEEQASSRAGASSKASTRRTIFLRRWMAPTLRMIGSRGTETGGRGAGRVP